MTAEPIVAAPSLVRPAAEAHPSGHGLRDILVATAFLLPNLALLGLFTYRPLLDNIRLSFHDWNVASPTATFIGWDNYVEWFTSPGSRTVLWNTVVFTGAA